MSGILPARQGRSAPGRFVGRLTRLDESPRSITRGLGRLALAAVLLSAGLGHLTTLREEFQAQVPVWVPLSPDAVVVGSGIVELVLGAALAAMPRRFRPLVGWTAATFFVAIFPGNISQLVTHTDAFGLDSDRARAIRLVFQPVLVAWALWSTGAWRAWRDNHRSRRG